MPTITFVKKIKLDGEPCRKCVDIEQRMTRDGHMAKIDRIVVADERDLESEGMVLAARHGVERAPFFLVEDDTGGVEVIEIYFHLVRNHFSSARAGSPAEPQVAAA